MRRAIIGRVLRRGETQTARRGLAATGVAQFWLICLNFASGIVMARLLLPEHFGLVAMVAPAVALVGLIQDLGLHYTVIQRKQISEQQISALFVTSAALSTGLAILLMLCAPLLVSFYSEPRLYWLVFGFAGLVVLWNLQSIPMALLSRQMNFVATARIEVVAHSLGFAAGATYAVMTGSYWAIVVASITTASVKIAGTWVASGITLRKPSFEGEWRELLGFGGSITLGNLFNYLERNVDVALIGRFRGAVELGYYNRAYTLLLAPMRQLRDPIGRVMLPFLSRNHDNPERYCFGYSACLTGMLLLSYPIILVVTIFANDVFVMLLGAQWRPAGEVFFWLGIAGMHQLVTSTVGWVLTSQGRGRDIMMTSGLGCLISVSAFVVGLPDGAVGIARAYAISDIAIKMPVIWWIATRSGPLTLSGLATIVTPHLAALAVLAVAFGFARTWINDPSAFGIAALIFASYCGYTVILMLFPTTRDFLLTELRYRVLPFFRGVRT